MADALQSLYDSYVMARKAKLQKQVTGPARLPQHAGQEISTNQTPSRRVSAAESTRELAPSAKCVGLPPLTATAYQKWRLQQDGDSLMAKGYWSLRLDKDWALGGWHAPAGTVFAHQTEGRLLAQPKPPTRRPRPPGGLVRV